MRVFNFIAKEIDRQSLEAEIEKVVISTKLALIREEGDLIISFKDSLTPDEETALVTVVLLHQPRKVRPWKIEVQNK